MKIKVVTEISDEQIAGLLCCAFEGGVGYWARIMDYKEPKIKPTPLLGKCITSYIDYPLANDGAVIIRDCSEEDEDDENYRKIIINRQAIKRGLQIMSEKYPNHWADFITEKDDAITGDVFLQCCAFGETIYG